MIMVVSCEAKKKQHARASSGLCNHYSELPVYNYTWRNIYLLNGMTECLLKILCSSQIDKVKYFLLSCDVNLVG